MLRVSLEIPAGAVAGLGGFRIHGALPLSSADITAEGVIPAMQRALYRSWESLTWEPLPARRPTHRKKR